MLVTVAEIKSYLSISSNTATSNAKLGTLSNLASALIENYCNRTFLAANVVEYHDGGTSAVYIKQPPIITLSNVSQFDGTRYVPLNPSNSVALSSTSNVWIQRELGKISCNFQPHRALSLSAPSHFNDYPNGVYVSYRGGYETIPNDLKLAALEYIKILNKGESGTAAVSMAGNSKSTFPLSSNMPAHIRRILDLYRIID